MVGNKNFRQKNVCIFDCKVNKRKNRLSTTIFKVYMEKNKKKIMLAKSLASGAAMLPSCCFNIQAFGIRILVIIYILCNDLHLHVYNMNII